MVEIDTIEYVGEDGIKIIYRATTVEGQSYTVPINVYYSNDHTLIAKAVALDDVPSVVTEMVERHVQNGYE